jgi:hypothetical protein
LTLRLEQDGAVGLVSAGLALGINPAANNDAVAAMANVPMTLLFTTL